MDDGRKLELNVDGPVDDDGTMICLMFGPTQFWYQYNKDVDPT